MTSTSKYVFLKSKDIKNRRRIFVGVWVAGLISQAGLPLVFCWGLVIAAMESDVLSRWSE